jgi:hypothetical protein
MQPSRKRKLRRVAVGRIADDKRHISSEGVGVGKEHNAYSG